MSFLPRVCHSFVIVLGVTTTTQLIESAVFTRSGLKPDLHPIARAELLNPHAPEPAANGPVAAAIQVQEASAPTPAVNSNHL